MSICKHRGALSPQLSRWRGAIAIAGLLASTCAQAQVCQGPIRPLPYPFGNALAFASDVDMQSPEYGVEMHKMINGQFGLPISDSLWVQGWTPGMTYFFNNVTGKLNERPLLMGGRLPTYFELLRQWYRGNIDHFHGWQADDLPRLKQEFKPPVALGATPVTAALHGVAKDYGFPTPPLLRVIADGPLPADAIMTFVDHGGKSVPLTAGTATVYGGYAGSPEARIYEWNLQDRDRDAPPPYASIDWRNLASLAATAASCGDTCNARLTALEFSGFGRTQVVRQSRWLKEMNVRPLLFTSHGGWTQAQNFYTALYKQARVVGRTLPPLALVDTGNVRRAQDAGSSDNALDLYRDLGMSLAELQGDKDFNFSALCMASMRLRSLLDLKLYEVSRTAPFVSGQAADDDLLAQVRSQVPDLSTTEIAGLQAAKCDPGCGIEADGVRSEILASLIWMRRGGGIEHLWYTHFGGVKSPQWMLHPDGPPYSAATRQAFGQLAAAYYGWGHVVPEWRRPWVTSATTLANYALMRSQIAAHIKTSNGGATVRIKRWTDPVTGRVMPSPLSPEADLNGITIYVSDSATAQVYVDDRPIRSVLRNAPDECGRASVTIADNRTPTSLLDGLELEPAHAVKVRSGAVRYRRTAPQDGALLIAADSRGRAAVEVRDGATNLVNTPYVMLEIDPELTTARVASLALDIEITTDSGRLLLTSDPRHRPDAAVIVLDRAVLEHAGRITLPLYAATWRSGKACGNAPDWQPCALPLGTVRSWSLRFKSHQPHAQLAVRRLAFLRANPLAINGVGRTVVIGGQVHRNGVPVDGVEVALRDTQGNLIGSLRTAAQGAYLFPGIPRGAGLSIAASHDGKVCTGIRPLRFRAERDSLDYDFDLANDCTDLPTAH